MSYRPHPAAQSAAEQPKPHPEQLGTCGRARATGQPCPDHPAVAEGARYIKRAAAEFDTGTALLVGEQVTAYAAAIQAATLRDAGDRIAALGKARGWSTWAADYVHPDREFVDPGAPATPAEAQQ